MPILTAGHFVTVANFSSSCITISTRHWLTSMPGTLLGLHTVFWLLISFWAAAGMFDQALCQATGWHRHLIQVR
jgi:hypothetical protein